MNDEMKESNVEEIEPIANADLQSAAWREVAREALTLVERIAWLAWSYLLIRLAAESFIAWMP